MPAVRGEIYDARFDPVEGTEQGGIRPAVVVSRDSMNELLSRVTVVPFTTARRQWLRYPGWILVNPPAGGLRVASFAMADQVRAISERRLLRRRGTLPPEVMVRIDQALLIALDLPGQV